jgi:hypothetical protein
MNSLTANTVRALVDDLDDIYRAAVLDGTIQQVFAQQKKALVSPVITKVDNY